MNSSSLKKGTKYIYSRDKIEVTFLYMESGMAIVEDNNGTRWAVYPDELVSIGE